MTLEKAALKNGWARRSKNGGLVWIESEMDVRDIWETATAAERERCARIAECFDLGTPDGHDIARIIRKADNKEQK